MITEDQVKTIAEVAARKAVGDVLIIMGIDTSDPQALLKAQRDWLYVRAWRESVERGKDVGIKTAVTVLVTGLLSAIGLWFSAHYKY